ncbi:MAG: hypothetical protein WC326_05700 [Candidatus Delongbacteria bacterium]
MSRTLTAGALTLALALGFTACDDNDDTHEDEHHLEAFGVALVLNGDTLVKSMSGEASEVVGRLELLVSQPTGPILLHFLDEEGAWFRPEADPDGEHSFALTHDPARLSVVPDNLAWSFQLTGLAADSTSLIVRVLHEGHDDYVSPALPVLIQP